MIWVAAIVLPYLLGVVGFFTIGTPIWPAILASCAVAALKNWRVALVMAAPIVTMQFVKVAYVSDQRWVFYAAIWFAFYVLSLRFFDTVLARVGLLISLVYASQYFNAPMALIDVGTEVPFIVALALVAINGPGGGTLSQVHGSAAAPSKRAGIPAGRWAYLRRD